MMMKPKRASAKLVRAAKVAAAAASKSHEANRKWVELFRAEYGHDGISDALVEVIDYSTGNTDMITAEFIAENSRPGED
jgi:hypothetical protein